MHRSNLLKAILAVVVLAPLPLASVGVWAWGTLAIAAGALLIAWALGPQPDEPSTAKPKQLFIIWTCFAAVVVWGLFQLSPLSPALWHHPIWAEAAKALNTPLAGAISLEPGKSLDSLLRMGTYAAIFWLCFRHAQYPSQAREIIVTVAISCAAYAAYGLAAYFSGTMTILWFKKTAYWFDLTSTFVNKNNYATYAGLGWLCTIALFFRGYTLSVQGIKLRSERLREGVIYIEKGGWRYLLAMILLIGALLYSHSRAGFASTLIGIFAFFVALAFNRKSDKAVVKRFGIVCFILAIIFFWAGGKVMDERIAGTDLAMEERPMVYLLTLAAIKDQLLLGSGLGSFEDTFRFYRTADIHHVFDFAHNSYLESALELGVPAALLSLIGLSAIAGYNGWGARMRRRDAVYPCLGLAATVLVGAHSLLDFSIQIPAVSVTYSAILGVAFAQSNRSTQ